METTNTFKIVANIQEARRQISNIASKTGNFSDFEYEVRHDKSIISLVTRRILNTLIQEHAATLA